MSRTRTIVGLLMVIALIAAEGAAQFRRGRGGMSRFARFATTEDFDRGFQFCRLVVRESASGDGAGWNVDYPRADINLSIRVSELTRTPVSMNTTNEPKPVLVNLGDPGALAHCPFAMMTEPGRAYFTPEEAAVLRAYLQRGGFLWADDYWGQYAWDFFETQLRQVLPSATHPIIDLPRDHPIFHQVLDASK